LTAFPAIESKRVSAALAIRLVPTADSIIVEVQKLCNDLTGLPIIQQQECICPTRNPVIFALTTHEYLKLKAFCTGKKTGTDHTLT
jgi:hypothetical protein